MKTLNKAILIALGASLSPAIMASPDDDVTIRVMGMDEHATEMVTRHIELPAIADEHAKERAEKGQEANSSKGESGDDIDHHDDDPEHEIEKDDDDDHEIEKDDDDDHEIEKEEDEHEIEGEDREDAEVERDEDRDHEDEIEVPEPPEIEEPESVEPPEPIESPEPVEPPEPPEPPES